MKLRTFLCLLALLPLCALRGAEPAEDVLTIEALQGDLVINLRSEEATYTNGVVVRYGPAVLTADKVTINQRSGETFAEGNVILIREGGALWRGERLNYNFKSRVMGAPAFRTGQLPYLAAGDGLVTDPTSGTYTATNAFFTTDDHPSPGYRIRAKKLVITPGKSIEARDATLYLGPVPVFYLPYVRKTLDQRANHFTFTPGYRRTWGAFLLSTYNWYWEERLSGAVNVDARFERGFAGGPDFFWKDPALGEGMMRFYHAYDIDPPSERGFGKPDHSRQRLLFSHQATIRPNFTVKGVLAYQSDPFLVRDFFESEYDDNVQPKSFLEVNRAWPNWSLDLLAQPQVNDFQETVERLPDLKLTGLRQQIARTPFYYESESSAGYFRRNFADIPTNIFYPHETNTYGATRVDTYHQVLLPWTFFGWLNLTPRIGQRFTYYSEVDTREITTEEDVRGIFNTGAEMTFKASRVWQNAENRFFEVRGLRHIMQPSLNYVWVPAPDDRRRELPQFDYELPSSRLLPIDFPDYNAIDSIDTRNVLRLGLRNKLQTKREDRIENLLNWAVYTDWRLEQKGRQHTFSDIYSDMDFRPRSWLTLNSETRFSSHDGKFIEANHLATIQPGQDWSLSVGHRYREDTRELGIGNNLVLATLYLRLNENWGFRTSQHFETRDGVWERQYYTIYRDFRSWTGALTLRLRDNRRGENDFTIAVTYSLKAFPRFGVGSDAIRPQRLVGG